MANLKRLIQGQDIRFDTHQAGDGQPTNWHHVHLEKILHKGGGKIRFPLAGGYEPNWSSQVSDDQYEKVRSEVQRELRKNEQLVNRLAVTIVDTLHRFSSGTATIDASKEAAGKLAGYFGLSEQFAQTVEKYMENRLTSFTSYHVNPGAAVMQEIELTQESVEIRRSKRRVPTANSNRHR